MSCAAIPLRNLFITCAALSDPVMAMLDSRYRILNMLETLCTHAARLGEIPLKSLAASRAGKSRISACGWTVDLSRHRLDDAAEAALLEFGSQKNLQSCGRELFGGAIVNPSENRPALHWALRASELLEGEAEAVRQSILPALKFARDIESGAQSAANGNPFKTVVHIGIGGSDFGPRLIVDAFSDQAAKPVDLRFAANVDPLDLDRALSGLDPAETLVVGVSKSFGTEETLYNLGRARKWLEAKLGTDTAKHLALVTANPDRATDWLNGERAHLFDMPLSVGGRFSLWSAASLACMIYLGAEVFEKILRGAEAMDTHTKQTKWEENLPMRLALYDYWNATVLNQPMRVQLAYAHRLRMLPTYLQQQEMESNGKAVGPDGTAINTATAPALWGGEGSVGQHSYHQWLHQGHQAVPCEFILAPDKTGDAEGRAKLIAHCLAQAEVLTNGRSLEEVKAEEPTLTDAVAKQKVHAGDRAVTFFVHNNFSPEALGSLIALFEHRTYFAGQLWGLNPFDQWGVERGKTMAGRIRSAIDGDSTASDPVTASLVSILS